MNRLGHFHHGVDRCIASPLAGKGDDNTNADSKHTVPM